MAAAQGNPTGQVLERSNQEEVVAFCHHERLVSSLVGPTLLPAACVWPKPLRATQVAQVPRPCTSFMVTGAGGR